LDTELLNDYLLLAGYALECVLKGCLLAKKPEFIKEDKLDDNITKHDIVMLYNECGIKLSILERQVLEILRWHLEWRKYPAPKKLKDMPSPVEPSNKQLDIPGSPFHGRKLQLIIDGLYNRGCDLIDSHSNGKR
jgi:hypothetical protein